MIYSLKLSCRVTKLQVVIDCHPPLTNLKGYNLCAVVRIQVWDHWGQAVLEISFLQNL